MFSAHLLESGDQFTLQIAKDMVMVCIGWRLFLASHTNGNVDADTAH